MRQWRVSCPQGRLRVHARPQVCKYMLLHTFNVKTAKRMVVLKADTERVHFRGPDAVVGEVQVRQ